MDFIALKVVGAVADCFITFIESGWQKDILQKLVERY